jgi:hypothetical protein
MGEAVHIIFVFAACAVGFFVLFLSLALLWVFQGTRRRKNGRVL